MSNPRVRVEYSVKYLGQGTVVYSAALLLYGTLLQELNYRVFQVEEAEWQLSGAYIILLIVYTLAPTRINIIVYVGCTTVVDLRVFIVHTSPFYIIYEVSDRVVLQ